MADRELERDARADAVAEQVRLRQAEVVEQPGDVIGQRLEPQRPVDVGGMPCPCSSTEMTFRLAASRDR
jgi:hypothetical protein